MEKLNCIYCNYGSFKDIWVCPSCKSFISLVEDEGIKFEPISRFKLMRLLRDRSCEHCGYLFNREILELIKLKEKKHVTDEQQKDRGRLFIPCPECRSLSQKIIKMYPLLLEIEENLVTKEKELVWHDKQYLKHGILPKLAPKPELSKIGEKFPKKKELETHYWRYNPLKKQRTPTELDYELVKRFRNKKKEWIDYFGITLELITLKKIKVYSNIEEVPSLTEQNKLDSVAESYFSGDLGEKIHKIYSPYLKKCKGFRMPKYYALKQNDITYIIIGVFKMATQELILQKMSILIENIRRKKVMNIGKPNKHEKMTISHLLMDFTILTKLILFEKDRRERVSLLDKMYNVIDPFEMKFKPFESNLI